MSALANWYPGHSVLDFCVIAAATVILVTATAWMVSLFLKRHPAIRHWVLLSALVASLASPFLALGFIASGRSFINVPLLIAEEAALAPELPDEINSSRHMQAEHGHSRSFDEPAPSAAPETILPTHRTGQAKAEAVRDHVATAEPKSRAVEPATGYSRQAITGTSDPFRSAVVGVLLLWLSGTLVVILGLFRGVLFLRRLCRSVSPITDAELGNALDEARRLVGARSLPTVGVSSLARAPMVAGLFRPIIVIPRSLLGAIRGHQLRDILTHEIAHVERRDNLVVLLQAIARAAFWPIPFLHLLNRELERAREEICDNHVLACRDAVSYGETLLRVAQLACGAALPVGTVGILHWRGKLEDRIFGLVHKGRSKMTRMHPLIALGVLALFFSASAILCGTTIVAAQPPQTASDKPAVAQEPPVTPQKPEKAQEKEGFTAWGKEVGGLQAGLGFRPGEQRAYRHGETVKLVVRVRNVGKKDVKFRYLKEFFMEKPPSITGGEGKTIRLGGVVLFGRLVHVPVDVNLAPGKEMELHDLKLKLAPASEGGDVTEVSPETLNGTGRFQIQYEQLAAASIDPNLTKLATAKLELEVKEAEKGEKEQKEAFTAWGKKVGGLQAGLGFRPGEKRPYTHGETVNLVVRVRNVSKEDVKFQYLKEFFMENPPLVTGGDGKTIRLGGVDLFGGLVHVPVDMNLAPGKEMELHDLKLKLGPAREGGDVTEVSPETLNGKGKFQIQYERVFGNSSAAGQIKIDPNLGKLATGKLELEVKEAEKQEKEAFTAWGKEVGGLQAGLGYRPGEKRAYHHGETVTLVVRVRNVGKKEVKFSYFNEFFYEQPPAVTDDKDNPVPLEGSGFGGEARLVEVNLPPGKELNLCEMNLELRAGNGRPVWTLDGTGKFQLHYKNVGAGNIGTGEIKLDPVLSKLATGKLELEVKADSPPPAATEIQGGHGDQPPGAEKPALTPQLDKEKSSPEGVSDAKHRSTAAAELAKLEGMWVLVSSERNGQAKSEEKNPYTLTFTGDKWKVHREDEVAVEGTVRLVDLAATPRKFNLIKSSRLAPGTSVDYGIYEWKGDMLRYCTRNGPLDTGIIDVRDLRPREFTTRDGDGQTVYLWKPALTPKEAEPPAATEKSGRLSGNDDNEALAQVTATVKETRLYPLVGPAYLLADQQGKPFLVPAPMAKEYQTSHPRYYPLVGQAYLFADHKGDSFLVPVRQEPSEKN